MSISQKLSDLKDIKADMRQAIIDSGTSVSVDEPLSGYSAKINAISIIPSGTLTVADNGTYNVTKYASCVVECETLYLKREIVNNIFQSPTTSFTFSMPSTVNHIGPSGLSFAFIGCTGLTSVDLSNLTTIGDDRALQSAFNNCTSLTSVDLSSLTTVSGEYAMSNAFYQCTSLTSVNLPSLTTAIGRNSMSNIFSNCTSLTSVDLSSLTTVSGEYAMSNAFYQCTSLTSVNLPSLTTISGNGAMNYTFGSCSNLTSVYFPKLKYFGSDDVNQFQYMCYACPNITLHFRIDMEDKVKALNGYNATKPFGATSGTVLFDLTRAELAFNVNSESTVSIYIDEELQS